MSIIKTLTDESGVYDVEIVIESDGWSGTPLVANSADDHFQFDIWGEINVYSGGYEGYTFTCEPDPTNYGYCALSSGDRGSIIGMSLEHMGMAIDSDSEPAFQAVCCNPRWSYSSSWGAKETDENLRIECDDVSVHKLKLTINDGETTTESFYNDEELGRYFQYASNVGIIFFRCRYVGDGTAKWRARIKTDLPIFATDADLLEYCQSGGTVTDKILNLEGDPEEEYENQFKFHYVKNIYGHNTQNASSYTGYRNYRFYPASKRMCFYRVNPRENSPFTLRLMGYDSGVSVKSAPVYADPLTDDDKYTTHSGSPEMLYLHKSISFGSNDYYSKFRFSTDLPVYGSESQARDYINNVIDERSAENWNDISRAYSETFDPNYGDPDTGNDNGVNGQSYVKGARLWVMESTDLNAFFDDIFNDVNINDILSGCQLFGQSAISCIMGVMYLPIDVDDVATVYSTKQTIKLGSWACPTAQGRYVQNNNKIIECGSFFVARVYNDFRDYEMKLSLDLPYIGTIETSIGRFLGKTLSIKYAVDITTGGCTAHIYADSIEMESYDGFMGSVRPLQALDQISHLNSVMSIVGSIGGRETGMINTATESFAGVATGSIGGSSKGGFNVPSSGVGLGGAIDLSAGAITDLYSLGQAVKDKPIAVRGSYAGCLGLFGCQKIHIRVQQPRIYRAPNLQQIAGFPSGVGQRVGMFSGFLSVISFQMVDGFTGTADELQEIYGILKQGIYI